MAVTLDDMIEAEVERRFRAFEPPIPYGIWLHGQGWLKHERTGRVFSDHRLALVKSIADMFEGSERKPVDQSAIDLESQLLEQEAHIDLKKKTTKRRFAWLT